MEEVIYQPPSSSPEMVAGGQMERVVSLDSVDIEAAVIMHDNQIYQVTYPSQYH